MDFKKYKKTISFGKIICYNWDSGNKTIYILNMEDEDEIFF